MDEIFKKLIFTTFLRSNNFREKKLASFTEFHCIKIVPMRSFFAPYFLAFRLNSEIYIANVCIQSECWKKRIRKKSELGHFSRNVLVSNLCEIELFLIFTRGLLVRSWKQSNSVRITDQKLFRICQFFIAILLNMHFECKGKYLAVP